MSIAHLQLRRRISLIKIDVINNEVVNVEPNLQTFKEEYWATDIKDLIEDETKEIDNLEK